MSVSESRNGHIALVTGASSGIGKAFAERLASDGYDLVLVARRKARLEELAAQLENNHGCQCHVIVADLTSSSDLQHVANKIETEYSLDFLVNNAGFLNFAPVAEHDSELMKRMVDLHVVATMRLTRAAVPVMLTKRRGSIINVASIGGLFPSPGTLATYAATKAFINTFTLGLHTEVKEENIRVQALNPGFTYTEIFDRAGIPHEFPAERTMTAETVVNASLAGLKLGEVICIPGLEDGDHLERLMTLLQTISEATMASGTPGKRYGLSGCKPLS